MIESVLNPEEIGLVIGVLTFGYVRDLHPNYRASITADSLAALDEHRAKCEELLGRLRAEVGLK